MFTDIRNEITRDFLELKQWVSFMPNEQHGFNKELLAISRGLFFVYVYGLYEKIIHNVIARTISILNNASIPIDKCIFELYSLIFSKEYDEIHDVGRDRKWEKRWNIVEKIKSNQCINIPNDIFPTDGKNLRYRQLNSLAKSFGVKDDVLPDSSVGGYINEMVDNRNHIAHGNYTPKEIGRKYTKKDLLKRCNIISDICSHTLNIYEKYIVNETYKQIHR